MRLPACLEARVAEGSGRLLDDVALGKQDVTAVWPVIAAGLPITAVGLVCVAWPATSLRIKWQVSETFGLTGHLGEEDWGNGVHCNLGVGTYL